MPTATSTRRNSRGKSPPGKPTRRRNSKPELKVAEASPSRRTGDQQQRRVTHYLMTPCSAVVLGLSVVLLAVVCSQAAIPTEPQNASAVSAPLAQTQDALLNAVKRENYDEVLRLAAKAKQLKEFEQVAEEVMHQPQLYGYSAIQVDAFFSSLMMIIVSELGDKTFFIAAVLAMKHPRAIVLAGALGALALMTVLSAVAGFALPNLMPRVYTHYASVVLFVIFGVKLLKDAKEMASEGPSEELEEVEAELSKKDKKREDPECG
eukprot:CAMPEP_0181326106 /NCGR_PEP_ID=MMETSP1101-20121128/21303_1 /TAXON_ID=46948 /ORGANISM="Rhodomonas abbreviata, Strain Caron Lab Isolate" /LENGTH=262 /DNA_ID=CAMNT_0023434501 /DNA_START=211 /DNA_END=996 /DNA_ORIENTATION=-